MIAVDTSTLIAYLQGDEGKDIALFDRCLDEENLVLAPVTLTETLCNPGLSGNQEALIKNLPVLPVTPGYWERAAYTRKTLLAGRRKANTPDTLIAQSCIDHDVALLTRDTDFQLFAKHCGLKLALEQKVT